MKTFCGFTSYKTLPNKYKTPAYSPSKLTRTKNEPKEHNGTSSIFTLPPRPKVLRSFSFSERRPEAGESRGRSQSVYGGLQSPSALSWIDSLSSSPCPSCSQQQLTSSKPISRSHSLVSLQHREQDRRQEGGPTTASIWSRARSESFRNIKDLADRENKGSAWSLVNKTLSPLLTKVETPKVPVRLKKQKRESFKLSEDSKVPPVMPHRLSSLSSLSSPVLPRSMTSPSTAPDLVSWLSYLGYEVYTPLFLSAGYDLATVSRVTPEDLTAVGIQLPAHRHRIMSAVAKLDVSDGLPDFVPSSLGEWLRLIRLESYHGSLVAQGYSTIHQVLRVSVEDLEDIGFYKLGHQKRLLLAIKKVKELQQGDMDSGRIRHLTMNSPRLSRISLSTFQSPEPEPEPSVTMPKPMEPLHNPMYMNSLAPYIDSLALPSHSLPPRSRPVHGGKPVAKVSATSRISSSLEGQEQPVSYTSIPITKLAARETKEMSKSGSNLGQGGQNRQRTRSTGDVLEDIGFMLSDLTCELDKMLELEDSLR